MWYRLFWEMVKILSTVLKLADGPITFHKGCDAP